MRYVLYAKLFYLFNPTVNRKKEQVLSNLTSNGKLKNDIFSLNGMFGRKLQQIIDRRELYTFHEGF